MSHARAQSSNSPSKVVFASLAGNTMEWYDFTIFSASSALVFSKIFFPNVDPLVGTLYSLLTYGVGFVARPLGGVLFGHFGDRIGRRSMLLASLLMMGFATIGIGLLPPYASAGAVAPALLVTLRILQGIALGGEYGGAALLVSEAVPAKRRGFLSSASLIGLGAGSMLGTAVFGFFASRGSEELLAWGWRVPYLLSAILLILGLWLRTRVDETPEFQTVQRERRVVKVPLLDVLRTDFKRVALVCGARTGETMQYNVTAVFALHYVTKNHGVSPAVYLSAMSLSALVTMFVMPAAGALSDRIGRRRVGQLAGLAAVIAGASLFPLITSGSNVLLAAGVIGMLGISAGVNNSLPSGYFPELFNTEVRYTAISLGYQMGTVTGGMTPAICAALFMHFGIGAIAAYVLAAGMLILLCFSLLPETYKAAAEQSLPVHAPSNVGP